MAAPRENEILRRIFRPAVRFCVRRCISISPVVESIKALFVECALEEMGRRGEEVAISRVSLISGLTRREVRRLLENTEGEDKTPSIITRVLSTWEQDPRFSRDRKPRMLSFEGEESEFRTLVSSITKDISAGTVLSELRRLRAVDVTPRGLKLISASHDHTHSEDRVIALLTRNLQTLTDAAEENAYRKPEIKNLHARTEYDNVSPAALPVIRQWLLERGLELHKAARDYLSQYDQDMNPLPNCEGGARVCLGSFSFSVDPQTAEQFDSVAQDDEAA